MSHRHPWGCSVVQIPVGGLTSPWDLWSHVELACWNLHTHSPDTQKHLPLIRRLKKKYNNIGKLIISYSIYLAVYLWIFSTLWTAKDLFIYPSSLQTVTRALKTKHNPAIFLVLWLLFYFWTNQVIYEFLFNRQFPYCSALHILPSVKEIHRSA